MARSDNWAAFGFKVLRNTLADHYRRAKRSPVTVELTAPLLPTPSTAGATVRSGYARSWPRVVVGFDSSRATSAAAIQAMPATSSACGASSAGKESSTADFATTTAQNRAPNEASASLRGNIRQSDANSSVSTIGPRPMHTPTMPRVSSDAPATRSSTPVRPWQTATAAAISPVPPRCRCHRGAGRGRRRVVVIEVAEKGQQPLEDRPDARVDSDAGDKRAGQSVSGRPARQRRDDGSDTPGSGEGNQHQAKATTHRLRAYARGHQPERAEDAAHGAGSGCSRRISPAIQRKSRAAHDHCHRTYSGSGPADRLPATVQGGGANAAEQEDRPDCPAPAKRQGLPRRREAVLTCRRRCGEAARREIPYGAGRGGCVTE